MNDHIPQSRFFQNEEIGPLRLLKLLRVRKQSEVWCGAWLEKDGLAAIKFFYPEQFNEEYFYALNTFLMNVDSPAIIKVHKVEKTVNGYPYIIMEYAEKGSLRSWLKHTGRGAFAQCVYLTEQMLEALCVLQRNRIIHRDIKPENIWISGDGSLRLGDFGIARLPDVDEESDKVFGTARYCSPEQALDSTKVDCRSDLYSLGAVVFEALTGKALRQEDSFPAAGRRQRLPLELMNEFSTAPFAGLISELLAFSVNDRPDSPAEILERLKKMDLPASPFIS